MMYKEISIGPDSSKDGDDAYKPDNITINKGDKLMWVTRFWNPYDNREPRTI